MAGARAGAGLGPSARRDPQTGPQASGGAADEVGAAVSTRLFPFPSLAAASCRATLLAVWWWALADGAPSWTFGAPVILLALVAGLVIAPARARCVSPARLLRFAPFFLRESLRGGIDVARRALHPRLPLAPALLDYRLRLPPGPARLFLVGVVSLLPGTLSADLGESDLTVHVLDRKLPVLHLLQALERQVAALFGVALPTREETPHG